MNFKLWFVFLLLSYVATPSMGQRPSPPISLSARLTQLEAEFQEKIENIKTETIRISNDQEEKIDMIKVRERILAQLLNQTREEMVGLKTQNMNQSKRIDQLEQKLTLLQNTTPLPQLTQANSKGPNEMVQESTKSNSKSSPRPVCENSASLCSFYHSDHPDSGRKKGKYSPTVSNEMLQEPGKVKGMPTNCTDLKLLGHNLNGVYLIQTSRPSQGVKIESVFCDFQSSASVSASQTLIGSVKIMTKNTFFYVQRHNSFSQTNAVIPWELERLNEGGAFDLSTGVFTASVPGIYHFEFHGVKDQSSHGLDILLQLNGNTFAAASTSGNVMGISNTLSLSVTLRLKVNDRVNLFNWKNASPSPPGILFDVAHLHVTHFSGWLLEEYLI